MFSGYNTKGGSNGHFNHIDPNRVNVSSLGKSGRVRALQPTLIYIIFKFCR